MITPPDTPESLMALYQSLLATWGGSDRQALWMYTCGNLPASYERAVEYCTLAEDRLASAIRYLVERKQ